MRVETSSCASLYQCIEHTRHSENNWCMEGRKESKQEGKEGGREGRLRKCIILFMVECYYFLSQSSRVAAGYTPWLPELLHLGSACEAYLHLHPHEFLGAESLWNFLCGLCAIPYHFYRGLLHDVFKE